MRLLNRYTSPLLFTLMLLASQSYAESILVIVNSKNNTSKLSEQQIENIFLMKTDSFPGGNTAKPVDQKGKDKEREKFYSEVTKKSLLQLQKYWAREMFSGRALPPEQVGDDVDVVEWVTTHVDGIGYIKQSALADGVKVVFEIP